MYGIRRNLAIRSWTTAFALLALLASVNAQSYGIKIRTNNVINIAADPRKVRREVDVYLIRPEGQNDNFENTTPIRAQNNIEIEFGAVMGLHFFSDPEFTQGVTSVTIQRSRTSAILYAERDFIAQGGGTSIVIRGNPENLFPNLSFDVTDYFLLPQKPKLSPEQKSIIANGQDTVTVKVTMVERVKNAASSLKETQNYILVNTNGPNSASATFLPDRFTITPGNEETEFIIKSTDIGKLSFAAVLEGQDVSELEVDDIVLMDSMKTPWYLFNIALATLIGLAVSAVVEIGMLSKGQSFRKIKLLEGFLGGFLYYCLFTLVGQLVNQPTDAFQVGILAKGLLDGASGGIMGSAVIEVIRKRIAERGSPAPG